MGTAGAIARFDGVKTRLLEDHERPYGTVDRDLPLVIEPDGAPGFSAISALFAARSREIKEAVYDHGAILLRGFEITSEREFEQTILSLQGVRAMESYFMPEPGRDLAADTRSVFVTNRYMKTGGSFSFLGFHSENFYSTDVPALQSFWCKTEPWLGGESGLVHAANAFADLPEELQKKLSSQPVASRSWTIAEVARAYNLSEERIEAFFGALGLVDTSADGQRAIVLHKPTVYRHPHHGKRALQVNFGGEATAVTGLLNRLLQRHYTGPKWAL
ncbi:MAG: TauD/TfdA family dioxygenase, partial [Minicystis sp.]